MNITKRRRRFGLRLLITALYAATPTILLAQEDRSEAWRDHAYGSTAEYFDEQGTEVPVMMVSQPSTTAAQPVPADDAEAKKKAAAAKKKKEELDKAMKEAYKGVYYANNFAYLDDPAYNGPSFLGDSFKRMDDGKLDIGGEYRSRYHNEINHRGLGLTGRDDQFWLTRVRLFSNYRFTENLRFFGEYIYADSAGETFTPRAIEENRGDAQNLFLDAKLFDDCDYKVVARAGRQELLLGNQRLVSPLDWANTRRTFDGYRMTVSNKETDLDLFYTNPVINSQATAGSNDWDSSDPDKHFYGAYLSTKRYDVGTIDLYYIGYDSEPTNFSFHTLGSQLSGKNDLFLYEFEGGTQFGDNANASDHSAYFATAGLGKKLELCLCGGKTWSPTVWGWYDWASGADQPTFSEGDNGFHHLFPLAHKYNGLMDLFGRRNLHDINAQLITPIGKKTNLLLWYHYFMLDQATTPYSIVMTPFNPNNLAASRDLGHEIDLLVTTKINPRADVVIGYSYFDSGDYYRLTPGVPTSENAQFFYSQFSKQF